MTSPPLPNANFHDIGPSLRSVDIGLRWLLTFVILALLFFCMKTLIKVPQMEKIFEDMLGSRSKLPTITQWFIQAHPATLLAPLVAACAGLPAVWLIPKASAAYLVGGLAALGLAVLLGLAELAFQTPLLYIIQGINGLQ